MLSTRLKWYRELRKVGHLGFPVADINWITVVRLSPEVLWDTGKIQRAHRYSLDLQVVRVDRGDLSSRQNPLDDQNQGPPGNHDPLAVCTPAMVDTRIPEDVQDSGLGLYARHIVPSAKECQNDEVDTRGVAILQDPDVSRCVTNLEGRTMEPVRIADNV